jgi:DNA-binding transcriptional LysR family regulator
MKKEVIMQAMAWGHLPRFLIEEELRDGRLLSIAGQHFPGVIEELAVVRRSDRPRGPVADLLWDFLAGHAPVLAPTLGRVPRASGDSQEPGRIER